MKVKSFFKDVLGSSRVTKRRKDAIKKASPTPDGKDQINEVAKALHPGKFSLKVISVQDCGKDAKTITFASENGHIPYFKAGQFLTLECQIGSSLVTRPYSLCSAPYETRGENPTCAITIKKSSSQDGFVGDYLFDHIKVDDVYIAEVGLGQFFYEPLRDAKNVVALAGGSGITPFLSMAKEIKDGKLDFQLTILYGSVSQDNIVLKEELEACVCDKVKVIHVLSGDNPTWNGEKGYLSDEIIKKYSSLDTSYFICGPQAMYEYVKEQLNILQVPARRIRFEVYGTPRDITKFKDYPLDLADKTFTMKVKRGILEEEIPALAKESIATALERAGIKIHTACRSGTCGVCRIKVLEGSYYVCPVGDGRRAADKEFHYVHACATYPTSDLTIKVNIEG